MIPYESYVQATTSSDDAAGYTYTGAARLFANWGCSGPSFATSVTHPTFGTLCVVPSQRVCSNCYDACNAGCGGAASSPSRTGFAPLSVRSCAALEVAQPLAVVSSPPRAPHPPSPPPPSAPPPAPAPPPPAASCASSCPAEAPPGDRVACHVSTSYGAYAGVPATAGVCACVVGASPPAAASFFVNPSADTSKDACTIKACIASQPGGSSLVRAQFT